MLTWTKGAAAALVAGLVSASACAHDWDSLEAAERGAGGTASGSGSGGTSAGTSTGAVNGDVVLLCEDYCDLEACAVNGTSCQGTCEGEMADCSQGELDAIESCFDNFVGEDCQNICAAWALGLNTCLATALTPASINCWSLPVSGC